MMNNDSSSLVRFSNLSEDFRLTNRVVPLRIDGPTMLKWSRRHMTSFAEETGHHLLRSDFSAGFGSGSRTHRVDCCFVCGSYA